MLHGPVHDVVSATCVCSLSDSKKSRGTYPWAQVHSRLKPPGFLANLLPCEIVRGGLVQGSQQYVLVRGAGRAPPHRLLSNRSASWFLPIVWYNLASSRDASASLSAEPVLTARSIAARRRDSASACRPVSR